MGWLIKALIGIIAFYSLVANAQLEGSVSFEINKAYKGQAMLLPVPSELIPINSQFEIFKDGASDSIESEFTILNAWSDSPQREFIRILLITPQINNTSKAKYTLRWRQSKRARVKFGLLPKEYRSNSVEYVGPPLLVYPSLAWLQQSILLHPKVKEHKQDWYVKPQVLYANYVTDKSLLEKKGYPQTKSSQWLYDRPQAIFQLYLMTGDIKWLEHGIALNDFYQQNINAKGNFKLRKRKDIKYLMPKGLVYKYLITGDPQALLTIEKLYKSSLSWDPKYTSRRGFWTERNQAAALNNAVSYWEVTGDRKAKWRIDDIIDATVSMTFSPENNWPLRGCPQHSYKSHEGKGDNTPVCSPWMMALLGDALWRYYLLTEDERAASLIDAFGDFVLNFGIYYGDEKINNSVIPKYIVSMENPNQEKLNQWSDVQHACDVAALVGKSAYIKQQKNVDNFMVKELFGALVKQCRKPYERLKKENGKRSYWTLKPPRRFGWVYSTTSDLPWLRYVLLNNDD